MIYQVLFSLINNEKIFKTVVCCSSDFSALTVKKNGINLFFCHFHEGLLFNFLFASLNDKAQNESFN